MIIISYKIKIKYIEVGTGGITIKKFRIIYKNRLRQTIYTNIHTLESIKKEIKSAKEEGQGHLMLNGNEIFPNQVKKVKELK